MGKSIIKFWGEGCLNCKALLPIFEDVKKEFADIEFKEINITKDEEASEKYGITSLPTLVFFCNGEEVGRMIGLKPKTLIVKKANEVFK